MKRNNTGFTLIEVLIALAILSIALTAIIRSTSQNIKDTTYLQNKTVATWVATLVINEATVALFTLSEGSAVEKETEILNQTWQWIAHLKPTKNKNIKKITVTVFAPGTQTEMINLESYLYAQPQN